MRARDFEADTRYLLDRHRLHNRLLHGWGIVCGLEVRHHPDDSCRDDWIEIDPGLAIDCYGREIVLTEKVRWKLPFDRYEENAQRRHFLVGVRFCERHVELVRVLYAEGSCDPQHAEANRLRDVADITTAPVHRRCWAPYHDHQEDDGRERHHDHLCFAPDCPCGDLVPLARIVPNDGKPGYHLDREGRQYLPPPASRLTRIKDINWPHGGTVTRAYLDDVMERRLRVTFSHPLQRPPDRVRDEEWAGGWANGRHDGRDEATGINELTFTVQYVQMSQALEFLPGRLHLDDHGRQAVFHVRRAPAESIVYVTLLCDFILDRDGVPVDGSFLRGRLPTGNGAAGGAFRSWFRVVPDERRRSHDE
jgi:hypothetical protein